MHNLKAALKIFHNQSQKMWDNKLHFLAFAFNSACHESIKICPSKLFLGRELNTPLENMWDLTEVLVSSEEERTKFWTEAIWKFEHGKEPGSEKI